MQDMACLRDAQLTVQMLLNQNDYPKALECIETAQDVLNNELRGVTCFRLTFRGLLFIYVFILKFYLLVELSVYIVFPDDGSIIHGIQTIRMIIFSS